LQPEFFGGEVSRYAAIPLTFALFPGYSDTTKFLPWLPIATGNHMDRAEKIPKVAQTTGTVDVLIRVQAFRELLRGEIRHAHVSINDGHSPLT